VLGIHKGYDVRYLTEAVGGGGADYYLSAVRDGGEPPGFWTGKGAAVLGLTGEVDAGQMQQLYHHSIAPDGSMVGSKPYNYQKMKDRVAAKVAAKVEAEGPFVTPERESEIRNQELRKVRAPLGFFDFTYSLPKSYSLAHAGFLAAARKAREEGDEEGAQECERKAELIIDALRETARRIVASFETRDCYTRTGHHGSGEGEWRDGAGVTAAVFIQHTSREGDPQLHAHIAVLNKVQRADGADEAYRTLDSRSVLRWRLYGGAVGDRIMAGRLTGMGLPLVQREDGNNFEIGGVDQATMAAFSSRRADLLPCVRVLVEEYEAQYGRAPSQRTLWSLRQWATLQTRKGKEHARSTEEELHAWEEQATRAEVQALAQLPGAIAAFARQAGPPAELDAEERHRAIRVAVAEVQRQHATWTAEALVWELARALPALPADVDPEPLLESMAAEALSGQVDGTDVVALLPPDIVNVSALGVRASDGLSIYTAPGAARYTTAGQLDMEDYLLQAGARQLPPVMTEDDADGALDNEDLSDDQRAAATGLLTSDRALRVFVGPAGAGKTHTIAAFGRAWQARTGARVIGLTTSTNAARVMTGDGLDGEGLETAYNIADFLGKIKGSTRTRGHKPVRAGDVLVIDEASQVSTADLAAIMLAASRAGARVVLAGDPEQLTSPEAGGAMHLLAGEYGYLQVSEIRRFRNDWEGPASLRIRDRDPGAFGVYQRHGLIRDGGQEEVTNRAVRLWLGDFLAGKDTLLLASTNIEAAELARRARSQLISLGRVDEHGPTAGMSDGNQASTGDLIRARENDKTITAGGRSLANRDILKITGWTGTGEDRRALAVRRLEDGQWSATPFAVPLSYLAEHADLAYAGNTSVAQGRTVDTGHMVVSLATGRRSLYVGMTRGRERNTAHVVTSWPLAPFVGGNRPAPGLAGQAMTEPVPAQAVLAGCLDRDDETDELTATEVMRQVQDDAVAMPRLHHLWKKATRGHSFAAYDNEVRRRLPAAEFDRYMTDPERDTLHRHLRAAELAGHSVPVTLEAVCGGDMTGARSIAAVLHGRIAKLNLPGAGHTRSYTVRTPHIDDPQTAETATDLAALMDQRARELGSKAADKPPAWAVRYLGVPPHQNGRLRQDWIERVGQVASYRELTGHADPIEAIGPLPATGAPEQREAWAACARALEMREEETGARSATRGELEARVTAYQRATAWAPHPVAADLEATSQAHADTNAQAEVAAAQAGHSRQDRDRQAAQRARDRAADLADRQKLLNEADAARQLWHEHTADTRARANEAAAELARRGHPQPPTGTGPDRLPGHDPATERAAVTRDVADTIDRARQAAERIEREREPRRGLDPDLFRHDGWREISQAQNEADQDRPLFRPGPAAEGTPAPEAAPEAAASASFEAER
jgi:conjugative relaxase-like TrwC/TraI family protein